MVATKTLEKKQMIEVLHNFLNLFQTTFKPGQTAKGADYQKFLGSSFRISSNNLILGKDLNDYLNRIIHLQKKYSNLEVSELLEAPLICDNKIVVHYDINLTMRNGQKKQINVMAIATMDDYKFTNWVQVTHEKGSSHWDA